MALNFLAVEKMTANAADSSFGSLSWLPGANSDEGVGADELASDSNL